jgi:hypothetical protein
MAEPSEFTKQGANSFLGRAAQKETTDHRQRMGDKDAQRMPLAVGEYAATHLMHMSMVREKIMSVCSSAADRVATQVYRCEPKREKVEEACDAAEAKDAIVHGKKAKIFEMTAYATATAASEAGASDTTFPGPCAIAWPRACSTRLMISVTTSTGS